MQMPDGSVVEFPDGMDPKDVATHWKAAQLVHEGQNSTFSDAAAATGHEFLDFARKAMYHLNINGAQTSKDSNDFGSAANIKKAEEEDKPLFSRGGLVPLARTVTDMAEAAPIGGPLEGAIGKLGTTALQKFGSKIAGAAASGGVTAGLGSAPGEGTAGAAGGSALGGALSALGSIGGRFTRGLVNKSSELQDLERYVDTTNQLPGAGQQEVWAPVSQGADQSGLSGIISRLYRSGLSYIPGVSGQLENQAARGEAGVRGSMLQQEAPAGYAVPPQSPKDMQLATDNVSRAYQEVLDNLRDLPNLARPKKEQTLNGIWQNVQMADPQIAKENALDFANDLHQMLKVESQNSKDGYINGWNLAKVRNQIPDMAAKYLPEDQAGMVEGAQKYIDGIFAKNYGQAFAFKNQDQMDALAAYKDYLNKKPAFDAFKKAVEAASPETGNSTFAAIARAAQDEAPLGDLQTTAQNANKVFGTPPAKISQEGRVAGYPLKTALGAGIGATLGHEGLLLPSAIAAGAFIGGGNLMATKGFQKGLYGDAAWQRSVKGLMNKFPRTAEALGYGARNTIAANAEQEDD